jgi:hypothetical protein
MDESPPPRGAEPAATARQGGLVALGVCAVVAVGAIIATVVLVSGPRPDATLRQITDGPDADILAILAREEPWAGIERSSLRGYEPYQGFEVWSAANIFGSRCLVAVYPETVEVVNTSCVPASAELFVDALEHGLPAGARIRFIQRGDTVDAYEYLPAQEQ